MTGRRLGGGCCVLSADLISHVPWIIKHHMAILQLPQSPRGCAVLLMKHITLQLIQVRLSCPSGCLDEWWKRQDKLDAYSEARKTFCQQTQLDHTLITGSEYKSYWTQGESRDVQILLANTYIFTCTKALIIYADVFQSSFFLFFFNEQK